MATKLYDLSVPVGYMTPDWMGHPPPTDRFLERVQRHDVPIAPRMTRRVSVLIASTWHKGTHCDVQAHHVENGVTTDKMPLENFYGTGVVVDFRYMKKWQVVTAEDLENANPKIEEGDIVIMNTGWHRYWRVNDYIYYNHYPGMYKEAGEWLLDKKVKMVGGTWGATDICLAHHPLKTVYPNLYTEYVEETGKDPEEEFPDYEPCHQIFSSNMIPAIENIGGDVDKVTGMRCTITAFPFKLADVGHMLRAVAIVKD